MDNVFAHFRWYKKNPVLPPCPKCNDFTMRLLKCRLRLEMSGHWRTHHFYWSERTSLQRSDCMVSKCCRCACCILLCQTVSAYQLIAKSYTHNWTWSEIQKFLFFFLVISMLFWLPYWNQLHAQSNIWLTIWSKFLVSSKSCTFGMHFSLFFLSLINCSISLLLLISTAAHFYHWCVSALSHFYYST